MLCYIYPSTEIIAIKSRSVLIKKNIDRIRINTCIEFVINLSLNFSRDRKERAAREM